MSKFEELVNDYTLVGDDGAVIFSSYDLFLEFVGEIRVEEREACAKLIEEVGRQTAISIRARG